MSSLLELQVLIEQKYGLDPVKLDPQASMRAAGIDSLTLVEFILEVEDKFKISVPDKNDSIDTLAELAQVIDGLRASQTA